MDSKKTWSVSLVLVLCILLSSCSQSNSSNNNSQLYVDTSSNFIAEANSYIASINSEVPVLNYSEATIHESSMQRIEADALYYTEILGVRKRYEYSLPGIIGFEYPYVFYERMSVVVESATEDAADLYVGRYSIETGEIDEIPIEEFSAISNEARLVIDERYIAYMYCTSDDTGWLIMNIAIFDMQTGTKEIIYSERAGNVFGYAKKLNSRQLIFMFYPQNADGSETYQIVLKYDMNTNEIPELYTTEDMDWSDSKNSTKNIWAIDTDGENIFLLSHQLVDGKIITFLDTLDSSGTVQSVQELIALSMYDAKDDVADYIVVKGDYLVIHYDQFYKAEENTNPPCAILKKSADGTYRQVDLQGIYPRFFIGEKQGSPELLYFSLPKNYFEPSNTRTHGHLFVFNKENCEVSLVDLGISDVQDFHADSSGNLIVYTRESDGSEHGVLEDAVSNWYYIPAGAISESITQTA